MLLRYFTSSQKQTLAYVYCKLSCKQLQAACSCTAKCFASSQAACTAKQFECSCKQHACLYCNVLCKKASGLHCKHIRKQLQAASLLVLQSVLLASTCRLPACLHCKVFSKQPDAHCLPKLQSVVASRLACSVKHFANKFAPCAVNHFAFNCKQLVCL